ncbi:MAG TPA: hypothetical protein VHO90_08540 [Bacteroidales bacterium]|nr:hypothetical protein [Bacteroidales bacterium]
MDFSDFEYHKSKIPSDLKEKEKFFQHLEQQFTDEIMSSPEAAGYFKNYSPDSVKRFIEMYAGHKTHLAKIYDYYAEAKQRRDLKFRNKAEIVFKAIKQKKLFNLQLQWRAELVTIDEVKFSADFVFWGWHINDCSFVPAITPTDIEIMKLYLREDKDACNQVDWLYNGQDYTLLLKNPFVEGGECLPEWYHFYDNRMGTGSLLLLPDKRGQKEYYYMIMGRTEIDRQIKEEIRKNPPPPAAPILPHLFFDAKLCANFAKMYEEDKHFVKLFDIYYKENDEDEEDECELSEIKKAIETLKEADGKIIMPGGMEWREAILHCANMYEVGKICEELDTVYSEYCMFRELGIQRGEKTKEELKEAYEKDIHVKIVRDAIFKGRELNGEPQDFNF